MRADFNRRQPDDARAGAQQARRAHLRHRRRQNRNHRREASASGEGNAHRAQDQRRFDVRAARNLPDSLDLFPMR